MAETIPHTVIVLVGPTAIGKTALAIQLAQQLQTSIISADSRQCYREMNIGVARPSTEQLAQVPHYFIASHSIHDEVNAGIFEQFALDKTMQLFKNSPYVVMVGGTGLYIKTFCEGIDAMPPIPAEIRKKIITTYEANGLNWLQQRVQLLDPLFWQQAEQQNPQRLMRALEMMEATGVSITTYRKSHIVTRPFRIIKIGMELERTLLNERINQRVDKMMLDGLLEEVSTLQQYQQLNALQTVGYQELFHYLKGTCTLEAAIESIKQHTRQYAKRQMTWFKKDSSIHWIDAAAPSLSVLSDLW